MERPGVATLRLTPDTTFVGNVIIDADTNGSTVNLGSNTLTVIPPASFTAGALTLVDIDANDGTINDNVTTEITVTSNALATYAVSAANATSDVILTATPQSAASIAACSSKYPL